MSRKISLIPLGQAVTPVQRPEIPCPGKRYRQLGVRLWGEGAYERESIDGSETKYKTLSRVEENDIVVNKIWARNGSVSIVNKILAGCYVSGEFPTFIPIKEKLEPRWFHWLTKTKPFWEQCDKKSRGSSGQNRIRPEKFLEVEIPLPPLDEQRRIVARIEELATKVEEVRGLRRQIEKDINGTLFGAYKKIIDNVQWLSMEEVAPLERRYVDVKLSESYPELGVRSFGKGTFHKPALSGLEVGTKKLFRIEPGDLIFQIVFAWEGAVAVAQEKDKGRCGSHRFLTCVPKKEVVSSSFLYFHFLTTKGWQDLGEASPGGAGRNRTLGLKALGNIKVPVPPYEKLIWFDNLQSKVDALKRLQAETAAELDALLPSILDKAFKGEL